MGMSEWVAVGMILSVPMLMMLTAKAVYRDVRLAPKVRPWLAAAVVLFPVVILIYWCVRVGRRPGASRG